MPDSEFQYDPENAPEYGQNGAHLTAYQKRKITEVMEASEKSLRPRDIAKHLPWSTVTVLKRILELRRDGLVGKDPITGGYYSKA